MTHEQVLDLLATFALDAVEADEYEQIEEHLATCPRCRAELDALREVAAALGNSVEPLPEGLWSSIAGRLPAPPDEGPPPMPLLVRPGQRAGEAGEGARQDASPGFQTPRRVRQPASSRRRLLSVASIAGAAGAVAAVLGINLAHDNQQISRLQHVSATAAVDAALHTPGHKVIDVDSAGAVQLARFVVLPSGQGYLVASHLPPLTNKETYQLWGVINGRAISLGLLGRNPREGAFTLAGSPLPSKLGVTVEPAGGSEAPTSAMVASGTV